MMSDRKSYKSRVDKVDLTGMQFHHWSVESFAERVKSPNGSYAYYYNCKCVCGKEKRITSNNLKSGQTKSCGCQRKCGQITDADMVGKQFGFLRVLRRHKGSQWVCRCENCGEECIKSTANLRAGRTFTCGANACKTSWKRKKLAS